MNTNTETQHTPGPWRWFIRDGDRGRIKGKPTHYTLCNDSRKIVIAPDYSEFNGEGVWESWVRVSDADARLIAAAPELLASLQAILDLEGEAVDANRYGTGDTERMIFGQARAAIAKATT